LCFVFVEPTVDFENSQLYKNLDEGEEADPALEGNFTVGEFMLVWFPFMLFN